MTEDAWIFKRFDGSATGPTEEIKEPSLNVIMFEIGQRGWEMISVHQKFHDDDKYQNQVFHFKRRVTD